MLFRSAHYSDFVNFEEMTGTIPDEDEDGNKISEDECRRAAYGYDTMIANLVDLGKWYKEREVPPSPKKARARKPTPAILKLPPRNPPAKPPKTPMLDSPAM